MAFTCEQFHEKHLLISMICNELRDYSLTNWGRDKMATIFQTTFWNAFTWMKMYKFWLRFHWSLFPRALVQIMAWHRPGDKPLSEPMMVSLLMHICVTRPQWVKNYCITQGPINEFKSYHCATRYIVDAVTCISSATWIPMQQLIGPREVRQLF